MSGSFKERSIALGDSISTMLAGVEWAVATNALALCLRGALLQGRQRALAAGATTADIQDAYDDWDDALVSIILELDLLSESNGYNHGPRQKARES